MNSWLNWYKGLNVSTVYDDNFLSITSIDLYERWKLVEYRERSLIKLFECKSEISNLSNVIVGELINDLLPCSMFF